MEYRFLFQSRIEDTINLLLIFLSIFIVLFFTALVAWTRGKKWQTFSSITVKGSLILSSLLFGAIIAISNINPYHEQFTELSASRLQYSIMAGSIVAIIIGISLVTTGIVWKKKNIIDERLRIHALALQGLFLFLAGISVIILQFR